MESNPTLGAVVIAFFAALPATFLGLAALATSLRNRAKVKQVEHSLNGQQTELVQRLVNDAWKEGHRAGFREHQALVQNPPENPPRI